MSWLDRLKKPNPPASTTIILYRNDINEPIVFNLQGLRQGETLSRVLVPLVQEHYCEGLEPEAEFLWQANGKAWADTVELVFNVGHS
jgi:hypothetical protein